MWRKRLHRLIYNIKEIEKQTQDEKNKDFKAGLIKIICSTIVIALLGAVGIKYTDKNK